MKITIGLILVIISTLGFTFQRFFIGRPSPFGSWWWETSLLIGIVGGWILFIQIEKAINLEKEDAQKKINKFKLTARKIELNLDKCDFKSGSYVRPVEDRHLSSLNIYGSSSLSESGQVAKQNIVRSYFIYHDIIDGQLGKFISQSFPFDDLTLKWHVLNQDIFLYVDRFDKNKYLFELTIQ